MTLVLLDVNALFAFAWKDHPFHRSVRLWLEEHPEFGWRICALTQLGLLRLSLNPVVMNGVRVSPESIFRILEDWQKSPRYGFIDQSPSLSVLSEQGHLGTIRTHKAVTDQYLVAVARANGAKLITFDRALAASAQQDTILLEH